MIVSKPHKTYCKNESNIPEDTRKYAQKQIKTKHKEIP